MSFLYVDISKYCHFSPYPYLDISKSLSFQHFSISTYLYLDISTLFPPTLPSRFLPMRRGSSFSPCRYIYISTYLYLPPPNSPVKVLLLQVLLSLCFVFHSYEKLTDSAWKETYKVGLDSCECSRFAFFHWST